MLDDAATREAGTPEWWLLRLGRRLADEAPRFDLLDSYWRGAPPMPHGNKRMREAYRRLQRMARTNFGALVAEAVLERLKVAGFRAGADADEDSDKQAWQWWQHNCLDADSGLVHRAAVVLGRSYVIVGEDPDDEGQPLVTAEDPRQVIHESHPTNRRKVVSALKTYWDDVEGAHTAVLYLPDDVHVFRSGSKVARNTGGDRLWTPSNWEPDGSESNRLGKVPVVPFVNRPDMVGNGLGEFADVIDILDRINTVILDRLVVSAMQAYRQRWAKGVSLLDENGNASGAFDPGADLLWAVESEAAQFGEFSPTDLTPIVKAIESDVAHLSAITRTPPHYILAGIVNASGDALAVAETGLTSKVAERMIEFGESWEAVYRLVAQQQGREIPLDAEVIWRDPQFRSLTERAAASVQLKAADVPWRTRMRMLDFTPQEIERMEAERAQDAMTLALQQPQPFTPGGQPVGSTPPADAGGLAEAQTLASSKQDGKITAPPDARGGGTGDTAIGRDAAWRELYQRAKALGIRGASKMTKSELQALVGGR